MKRHPDVVLGTNIIRASLIAPLDWILNIAPALEGATRVPAAGRVVDPLRIHVQPDPLVGGRVTALYVTPAGQINVFPLWVPSALIAAEMAVWRSPGLLPTLTVVPPRLSDGRPITGVGLVGGTASRTASRTRCCLPGVWAIAPAGVAARAAATLPATRNSRRVSMRD